MATDNFPGEVTQYGFKWGPMEVVRVCSDKKGGVVIWVQTAHDRLEIRASPGGRKLQFDFTTRKEETNS